MWLQINSVTNVWTHYRIFLIGPGLLLTFLLYICIYICICKHIHGYFCFSSMTLLEGSPPWSISNIYCCADASAHTKSWFSRKLFYWVHQGCRNCGWGKDSNLALSSEWEILSGLPWCSRVLQCVCSLLGAERKRHSQIFYHQMLMVKCHALFKTAEAYLVKLLTVKYAQASTVIFHIV